MKWTVKKQPEGTIDGLDAHPIVHMLLKQRGIDHAQSASQFLRPDYERDLHDPFLFRDMRKVVDRIARAREKKEKIGIFGDHDVDGISGATILSEACEALGIVRSVYIPDKHTEGHGINTTAIDQFISEGITLMISVDCGSTSVDEVAYAQKRGIETIIIDHHTVPDVLPDAYAMINPKSPGETYPFDGLCGTGAAFKVVIALYREMLPDHVEQLKWILDIVGVGTVADVMPLVDENRTIVKYGLLVLSKSRRVGYQEMISVGRIPIGEGRLPDARTIAFHIAPRINAAGRMAHAQDAYDLLCERDRERARLRAVDIEEKNKERQKITQRITKEVSAIVEEKFMDKKFIFAAHEEYAVGVVGIIAGRLASTYHRPAGIFHKGEKESRGSFRSVAGVSLMTALEKCKYFLVKYGGHDQAAGATIKNEHLDHFAQAFDAAIEEQLRGVSVEEKIEADLVIDPSEIDFDLVHVLEQFAPFGHGNREPIFFLRDMHVSEKRAVGNGEKHIKLSLRAGKERPHLFDTIGFDFYEKSATIDVGHRVDVLCTIGVNEWKGTKSIQLQLVDIRHALA